MMLYVVPEKCPMSICQSMETILEMRKDFGEKEGKFTFAFIGVAHIEAGAIRVVVRVGGRSINSNKRAPVYLQSTAAIIIHISTFGHRVVIYFLVIMKRKYFDQRVFRTRQQNMKKMICEKIYLAHTLVTLC